MSDPKNPFENILKQAQSFQGILEKAQQNMVKAQESLKDIKVVGEAGGGAVKITFQLNFKDEDEAIAAEIEDSAMQEDKKVLQGLIIAAINDAAQKKRRVKADKFKEVASSMGLPEGFNFPFGGAGTSEEEKK